MLTNTAAVGVGVGVGVGIDDAVEPPPPQPTAVSVNTKAMIENEDRSVFPRLFTAISAARKKMGRPRPENRKYACDGKLCCD